MSIKGRGLFILLTQRGLLLPPRHNDEGHADYQERRR